MPLFQFGCANQHEREVYAHTLAHVEAQAIVCETCGLEMAKKISMGRGLTYFASGGKGKWIYNLADKPVYIESPAQHERLMKEHGVAWAPPRRGMKGCW